MVNCDPRVIRCECVAAQILAVLCCAIVATGADAVQEIDPHGKPKNFEEGDRNVFALWFEGGKWHLSVRGEQSQKVHFHGRITTSDGELTDVALVGLERIKKNRGNADFYVPLASKKGFDFSFANFGGIDGLTFKASDPSGTLKIDLILGRDDDPKKNPDNILIGSEGTHPTENPFLMPAESAKPKGKASKAGKK
jgi:hypothetical protein